MGVSFWHPRPQALVWKRRPMAPAPFLGRGDVDNRVKAVFDALEGSAFFNDNQFCGLIAWDWWVGKREYDDPRPRVEIAVASLTRAWYETINGSQGPPVVTALGALGSQPAI